MMHCKLHPKASLPILSSFVNVCGGNLHLPPESITIQWLTIYNTIIMSSDSYYINNQYNSLLRLTKTLPNGLGT